MSDVNREALTGAGEETDEGRGAVGGMRRIAAAMGMTSEHAGNRGGSRGGGSRRPRGRSSASRRGRGTAAPKKR
jgi:hypothetical protein